jgi:hypothetical protein
LGRVRRGGKRLRREMIVWFYRVTADVERGAIASYINQEGGPGKHGEPEIVEFPDEKQRINKRLTAASERRLNSRERSGLSESREMEIYSKT